MVNNSYLRNRSKEKPEGMTGKQFKFWVDSEIAAARYEQCKGCSELNTANFCRKCGCFMPAKTKIAMISCPLGKWPAESNY